MKSSCQLTSLQLLSHTPLERCLFKSIQGNPCTFATPICVSLMAARLVPHRKCLHPHFTISAPLPPSSARPSKIHKTSISSTQYQSPKPNISHPLESFLLFYQHPAPPAAAATCKKDKLLLLIFPKTCPPLTNPSFTVILQGIPVFNEESMPSTQRGFDPSSIFECGGRMPKENTCICKSVADYFFHLIRG